MLDATVTVDLGWTLQLLAILSFVWLAYKVARYGRREKGLPPGPPTVMGLGNIHLMPRKAAHLQLTKWAREYGEIYSLKIGHQTFVVLNGPSAVQALMEKGSKITAARPSMWLFDEFLYSHDHLTFTSLPSNVTTFRRFFTKLLNKTASRQYVPVQKAESCQLLYELLTNSPAFFTGVKRFTFSQILSVAFGVRSPRWESPWCKKFYECTESMGELLAVGATPPLDLIPVLRFLPEALAQWKKQARELRHEEREFSLDLLGVVRERIAANQKNGSYMEAAIEGQSELGLTDSMLRVLGVLSLQGGADTTACFLLSAVLLLLDADEVQARAQKELDDVVGSSRMPTFEDVENLPYIRAIVKEVERLRPVGPLGIPHRTTEDQMYAGYLIPDGASLFVNCWAMGHDPSLFQDPEKFLPERFMSEGGASEAMLSEKSSVWGFGVGLRICPGLDAAKNTIHIVLARLLWAFDIVHSQDATGKPIPVDTMNHAEGVQQCPNEFPCNFRVRSPAHADAIKSALREAMPQLKLFEVGLSVEDAAFVEKQRDELS